MILKNIAQQYEQLRTDCSSNILFELNQRYLEIKHKSETLLDMTGVLTGLSHARRSARLEWIIIILIAIEIVIYLLELLSNH